VPGGILLGDACTGDGPSPIAALIGRERSLLLVFLILVVAYLIVLVAFSGVGFFGISVNCRLLLDCV